MTALSPYLLALMIISGALTMGKVRVMIGLFGLHQPPYLLALMIIGISMALTMGKVRVMIGTDLFGLHQRIHQLLPMRVRAPGVADRGSRAEARVAVKRGVRVVIRLLSFMLMVEE